MIYNREITQRSSKFYFQEKTGYYEKARNFREAACEVNLYLHSPRQDAKYNSGCFVFCCCRALIQRLQERANENALKREPATI